MTDIVATLRQYGHVSTNDIVLDNVTYWTDDQLEIIADSTSVRKAILLVPAQMLARTVFKFDCPRHYYAESDLISVYNDREALVDTPFTYNYLLGELTFDTALSENYTYVVEAKFTNTYEALANLWGQKAQQRFDYIKFKGGDNQMEHDQEYEHCICREQHYKNLIIKRLTRGKSTRWSI